MQLASSFNSVAKPDYLLNAVISVDGDLHLRTCRLTGDDVYRNAQIRLRTYAGGGKNLLLRTILAGLVAKEDDPSQGDMFAQLYASSHPNYYQTFNFRCDDNSGSHLRIAIADQLFGLQTNCHDEEQDRQSGGLLSVEGEGPMVWLHKDLFPKVYADLKAYIINRKKPDPVLYSDQAFHPFRLEAA